MRFAQAEAPLHPTPVAAVGAVAHEPGARPLHQALRPLGASRHAVQSLLEDPRLQMLRDDADFWAHVEAGQVDG
jgi:hypothetical protein